MKVDKETLPIYISVALSLITFFAIWMFGGTVLVFFYEVLLPVIFSLWIFLFILLMARKDLRKIISPTAITNAFIIFLGALFISLSRFKTEIAKVNIDMNMIGVGLALIAIGLGFTTQYREHKEQRLEAESSTRNSTPEIPSESVSSATGQPLPSVDLVLEEARRTLDFQFEQLDALDTKSGILLGIAGVVITLLVTASIAIPDLSNSLVVKIMGSIIAVTLFISLILSYWNLRIGKWHKPPELDALINDYVSKDSHTTKCKLIGTIQQAVQENEKLLQRRFFLYERSHDILFAGLALVTISVIALIFI
jgi:hypothetical protein